MTPSRLAAQLYTVREYTQTAADFAESMSKISEIGFASVQVSAIGSIPHKEVKTILDNQGLSVCNTHIDYDRLWNDTNSVIDQHKMWDCEHVAIGRGRGLSPIRARGV
jgi:hypothetical protein